MSEKTNYSKETFQQSAIIGALQEFILDIPKSNLSKSDNPEVEAKKLIESAKVRAGFLSAMLAIPPGPLGLITIIPDLVSIWKIQAQLVADISALYGKTSYLTKETMAYCLFKHGGMHLFKDIVVRVGERLLIKRTSLRVFQKVISSIGIKVTQRVIGKSISNWIPFVGAALIGVYSSSDTGDIGNTTLELMKSDIQFSGNEKEESNVAA